MNEHDLEGLLSCFDPDYRSEQPAHPNRGFGGREQVRANWSELFEGIPDFRAEVLTATVAGETVWCEWQWSGTRNDRSALDVRGVTLFEVRSGRIVSARLYMEEVEEAGEDIDEAVRRLSGTRGDRPAS
jgi:ketosteroid isomerase-like protein